jgi:16S rRNA G1207 methylase RsmC
MDSTALKRDIVVPATLRGFTFTFASTWGLFSPRAIDAGTRLLIENLDVRRGDSCLDLGCGYGAIGLTMARLCEPGVAYLVDKDFVAVEYAQKNAASHRVENCYVFLSNGFRDLPDARFDVVASNLPANVGKEMLTILLSDARSRLRPSGRLFVVTISGLREFIKRNFQETFGNYTKVAQGQGYTVALATVP